MFSLPESTSSSPSSYFPGTLFSKGTDAGSISSHGGRVCGPSAQVIAHHMQTTQALSCQYGPSVHFAKKKQAAPTRPFHDARATSLSGRSPLLWHAVPFPRRLCPKTGTPARKKRGTKTSMAETSQKALESGVHFKALRTRSAVEALSISL